MRQLLLVVTVSVLVAGAALAQPQPVKVWDFETGTDGWMTADQQAKLSVSQEAAHVNSGTGSLQFSFTPRVGTGGDIPGAVFVGTEGGVSGAQALHFAMQSSSAGPMMALLREQDESTYVYMFYLPADQWQVLDLPLADFHLEDSSKDEDGKLTLDQVGGIGFIDPVQWFMQASQGGKAFPFYFTAPSRRDLWLDEVKLMPEAPAMKQAQGPGGAAAIMIEDCDSDVGYWGILGGKNLRATSDNAQAVDGNSLRLDYDLPSGTLLAVVRQVPVGALSGIKSIMFSGRAGAECMLGVSVEENDKSRYSGIVQVPAGKWQQFVLPLRDFTLDDDSQDPDAGLQPEKIRSIQFLDATALIAGKDTANSLWLDEVMAGK
jgi:hypothetical protein